MDWNADTVVTAQLEEPGRADGDTDDNIIEQFRTFFHEYSTGTKYPYREEIEQRRNREDYWIELDLDHMSEPNPSYDVSRLVDAIKQTPARYLPLLNEAARREATSTLPDDAVQIPGFFVTLKPPKDKSVSIKDINEGNVGSLIAVRGLVLQSSRVSCALSDAVIQCRSCRSIKTIHIDPVALLRSGGHFTLPATCDNTRNAAGGGRGFEVSAAGAKPLNCGRNPYSLVHAQSTFVDFQTIRLQERHEDLLMGDMPRHIRLIMQRNLVNRLKPGMNVTVYGILQTGLIKTEDASVHSNFLAVVGMRDDSMPDEVRLAPEGPESSSIPRSIATSLEDRFRQFSQVERIIDLIAASIEPAIYGHESVKLALAALLFGGRRTILSDGMRIRGDINVLLLGDPGTAKSQFLKFVNQVAPLSVFTSGKGSSAAGLTASVIKEPASGEWYLEGGAMVLADGGVVCIDEFDKMDEEDRVAIHEAMEQQTISIAKAGITTVLNSRCSVLAAANPVFGSFDDFRSAAENIDFQTTILSRFDLIFLIRDSVDTEEDKAIAEKVILLRTNDGDKSGNDLISPDFLKQYIAYARRTCHPNLSEKAARVLQDGYVLMRSELEARKRQSADGFGSRADKHIPITVRQLEALIRISQAFARMCLQPEVTDYHAQRALDLFRSANDLAVQQQQGPAADSDSISRGATRIPGTGGPGFFKRIEDEIRMQIRVGTEMSYQVLCDNVRRVLNVTVDEVRRVCEAMIAREELEQRARRKRIFRRR